MKDYITDAHVHLADSDFGKDCSYPFYPVMFSCTARPSEWKGQMELAVNDKRIVPFFGTHPWYCSEHDNGLLEEILRENPYAYVGEIGLDALKDRMDVQKTVFGHQLELAERYQRTATVHIMNTEKETLDALRKYNLKSIILHSFDSQSYVKPFSDLGCYFSVSPRILRKSDEKLTVLLKSIPIERLLVESDYPGCKGSVDDLVSKISAVLSVDGDELINITGRNARNALK